MVRKVELITNFIFVCKNCGKEYDIPISQLKDLFENFVCSCGYKPKREEYKLKIEGSLYIFYPKNKL